MNKASKSFLQIRVIYVATTIFLVTLSVYTFIEIKSLMDSFDLITHTNQVNQSLQIIYTSIIQAEDYKRGFILSGDSSYLQQKEEALMKMNPERHKLYLLIKDNPQKLEHLLHLDTAIAHKKEILRHILLPEMTAKSAAEAKSDIREAAKTMFEVKLNIDTMLADESSLMVNRATEYTKLSFITPLFMFVFFLGAMIILWASYLKITAALRDAKELQLKLIIQNNEREKKEAELVTANKHLHYESNEKENRAAELVIANRNLLHESIEKENRAAELIIANKELAFQVNEKERKASELVIANKTLLHESTEKENRAAELVIANKELAFQIEEKEKRALDLISTNKELQLFAQIASHDLQEPLRKIQMFTSRIEQKELPNFSEAGKGYFEVIQDAAERMQVLIQDLIAYAQTNNEDRVFEDTNLIEIIESVREELSEALAEKNATIETEQLCQAYIIPFQFRQLMTNLISNSLKFSRPEVPCLITMTSVVEKGDPTIHKALSPKRKYCHIIYSDNGIGFENTYNEKIFEVFQRLHGKETYKGTGIGLAIVKKIVDNHYGIITASGNLNKGATFHIYLPTN